MREKKKETIKHHLKERKYMKKFGIFFLSLLLIIAMVGCSNENEKANESTTNNQENVQEVVAVTPEPIEPTSESLCVGCQMKIYLKDEEMGQFTAQAVTEDGEHVFFDDSGCLLNYARKTEQEYQAAWVRDYYSLDWIVKDEALAVHSDIKTPMKMGNAFFQEQDEVNQFIEEKTDLHPTPVTWEDIDEVAYERYLKKMQSQNKENSHTESEQMNM